MGIQAIDHVQLTFEKGQEAEVRHFYGDLLGLGEIVDGEGRAGTLRFEVGAQRLDFFATPTHTAREGAHLALSAEGLPGIRQRLLHAGLQIDEGRRLPGHRRLYVTDPVGNQVELLEPDWEGLQ